MDQIEEEVGKLRETNGELEKKIAALQAELAARQHVQESLQVSDERYRMLFTIMNRGVMLQNAQGTILAANPSALKILGLSLDQVLGKVLWSPHWPARREDGSELLAEELPATLAMHTGQAVYGVILRLFNPIFNTIQTLAVDAVPLSAPGSQRPYQVYTVFEDITERKQAEEALRESEERFRTLMMQAPIAIELFDLNGVQIAANQAYADLWGIPTLYTINRLRILENKDFQAAGLSSFIDRAYAGETVTIPAYKFDPSLYTHRKDLGRARWVETQIFPIKDQEDKVKNIVVIHTDITEQKQAEIERERLNAQLRQAQKMEAVGRLAGGVAHDFNNMLSVILGNTELALMRVKPSHPLHENLKEIESSSRRSADLTRQLLAFARKQTIAPKVLNINATIESMLKMLTRLIGENIELVWKPGSDLWPIKMDPTQIDQILANLAVNARDAISGVGTVIIETHNVEFADDYCQTHVGFIPGFFVLLEISDSGHGMDKEVLAKVFEPFFTTKPQGHGTGLGLATVYGIVKQNGGFINVYSEPGKGSTFKIYFASWRENESIATVSHKTKGLSGGSETILLVEDEDLLLITGAKLIERLGYKVFPVDSPTKAIQLAKEYEGHLDLMITDVVLPEMNGRDLLSEIQKIRPDLKCLFNSGYTADIIVHQGILDEGVHFLQKPYTGEELAAKIREALDQG